MASMSLREQMIQRNNGYLKFDLDRQDDRVADSVDHRELGTYFSSEILKE